MNYRELRDLLNTLTDAELDQNVITYSGDIDDTIAVIGTAVNTDEAMGEALEDFDTEQLLLVLA
jgi:hypothetical protein